MAFLRSNPTEKSQRYSAKNMAKPVNFIFVDPSAKHVSIAGDFNHWHSNLSPMKRQPDGAWLAQLLLHHGHHRYYFVVDGKSVLDPKAQGTARNQRGEKVSLIAVS